MGRRVPVRSHNHPRTQHRAGRRIHRRVLGVSTAAVAVGLVVLLLFTIALFSTGVEYDNYSSGLVQLASAATEETREEKIARMNQKLREARIERAAMEEKRAALLNAAAESPPTSEATRGGNNLDVTTHSKEETSGGGKGLQEEHHESAKSVEEEVVVDDIAAASSAALLANLPVRIKRLEEKRKAMRADIENLRRQLFSIEGAKGEHLFFGNSGSLKTTNGGGGGVLAFIKSLVQRMYFAAYDRLLSLRLPSFVPSTSVRAFHLSSDYTISRLRVASGGPSATSGGGGWFFSRWRRGSDEEGEKIRGIQWEEVFKRTSKQQQQVVVGVGDAAAGSVEGATPSEGDVAAAPLLVKLFESAWLLPGNAMAMFNAYLAEDPQTQMQHDDNATAVAFSRIVPSFFGVSLSEEHLNVVGRSHQPQQRAARDVSATTTDGDTTASPVTTSVPTAEEKMIADLLALAGANDEEEEGTDPSVGANTKHQDEGSNPAHTAAFQGQTGDAVHVGEEGRGSQLQRNRLIPKAMLVEVALPLSNAFSFAHLVFLILFVPTTIVGVWCFIRYGHYDNSINIIGPLLSETDQLLRNADLRQQWENRQQQQQTQRNDDEDEDMEESNSSDDDGNANGSGAPKRISVSESAAGDSCHHSHHSSTTNSSRHPLNTARALNETTSPARSPSLSPAPEGEDGPIDENPLQGGEGGVKKPSTPSASLKVVLRSIADEGRSSQKPKRKKARRQQGEEEEKEEPPQPVDPLELQYFVDELLRTEDEAFVHRRLREQLILYIGTILYFIYISLSAVTIVQGGALHGLLSFFFGALVVNCVVGGAVVVVFIRSLYILGKGVNTTIVALNNGGYERGDDEKDARLAPSPTTSSKLPPSSAAAAHHHLLSIQDSGGVGPSRQSSTSPSGPSAPLRRNRSRTKSRSPTMRIKLH